MVTASIAEKTYGPNFLPISTKSSISTGSSPRWELPFKYSATKF